MPSANLDVACIAIHKATVVRQVFMKTPLLAKLILRRRVSWRGGLRFEQPVSIAELDDLAQSYVAREALTSGEKDYLGKLRWGWKRFQVPLKLTIDDIEQNYGEGEVVDLSKSIVAAGHRAGRLYLQGMMWKAAADGPESGKYFGGIPLALGHDRTYGAITTNHSTTPANDWAQGASLDGTYGDAADALTLSLALWDEAVECVQTYTQGMPGDYLALVGGPLYRSLKAQMRARQLSVDTGGELARFGFSSFVIDGIEVCYDPWLTRSTAGTLDATRGKYFSLLHIPDWELRLHPKRAFKMMGWKDQAERDGGDDSLLNRLMTSGNVCCKQPRGSLFLSNVSG